MEEHDYRTTGSCQSVFVIGLDGARGKAVAEASKPHIDSMAVIAYVMGLKAPSGWDAKVPSGMFEVNFHPKNVNSFSRDS